MSQTRLVVADVDGTLVTPDKVLTARTQEAVKRLRNAGIYFAITSGRPPRGMAMLTKALKLDTPIAAFNGGIITKPDLKTVLIQRTIPETVAGEVVEFLQQHGLDTWVYRGADWFICRADAPHVTTERNTLQFDPTVTSNLNSVLNGTVKIVGVSDDPKLMAKCELELQQRVGNYVCAALSQPYYLDITHPEANKGRVLRYHAQHLGIPFEDVVALGDSANDVLMFGVAGISIAMGNASLEVRRAARFVTTSNQEEGFANAIDRFVLGKPLSTYSSYSGAYSRHSRLGLPPFIRACLFDLDGVLTQTAKLHAIAWKQMFDAFLREWSEKQPKEKNVPFVPFDPVHDYTLYVDGKLRLDGARSFLVSRNINLPEEKIRELANRKDSLLMELLQHERVETYDGSIRYVHAIRNAGLKTAVVSSSKHCKQILASAGIADLFDVEIDGNIAAEKRLAGKPAPDTYLEAARTLDIDPAQAAVFEDALSGVEAGRAGHFGYVVGVDRVGQSVELCRHGADTTVTDLSNFYTLSGTPCTRSETP